MNKTAYKVLIFNSVGLILFVIGLAYGVVQPVFINDYSHFSYVIAALFFYSNCLAVYDLFWPTTWIDRFIASMKNDFFYLGLIGTVIGLAHAIADIKLSAIGSNTDQVLQLISTVTLDLSTAFTSTLVGVIASRWIGRVLYLKEDEVEESYEA